MGECHLCRERCNSDISRVLSMLEMDIAWSLDYNNNKCLT